MAVKQVRVDDLTGTEGAEAVTFSLDGKDYEIDLGKRNAAKLRKIVGEYIPHARKVTGPYTRVVGTRTGHKVTTGYSRAKAERTASNALIRAWGAEHGWPVTYRGRVPDDLRQAYAAREDQGAAPPLVLSGASS